MKMASGSGNVDGGPEFGANTRSGRLLTCTSTVALRTKTRRGLAEPTPLANILTQQVIL